MKDVIPDENLKEKFLANGGDYLKISPSYTKCAIRIKDQFYRITHKEKLEEVNFVKLSAPKLDFQRDFFFLTDYLLAVPIKEENFYAIVRSKDGTVLCKFDAKNTQFIFNTIMHPRERAPDAVP